MFLAERMLDGPGEPDDHEFAQALDRLSDLDDLGIAAVDLAEHFRPDDMPLLADLSNPVLRLRAPAAAADAPVFGGRSGRPLPLRRYDAGRGDT